MNCDEYSTSTLTVEMQVEFLKINNVLHEVCLHEASQFIPRVFSKKKFLNCVFLRRRVGLWVSAHACRRTNRHVIAIWALCDKRPALRIIKSLWYIYDYLLRYKRSVSLTLIFKSITNFLFTLKSHIPPTSVPPR